MYKKIRLITNYFYRVSLSQVPNRSTKNKLRDTVLKLFSNTFSQSKSTNHALPHANLSKYNNREQ